MLMAALLSGSLFWTDVGPKQALICPPSELPQCLQQLPDRVKQQLPLSQQAFFDALGRRGAMSLPVEDDRIAGMVLWAPQYIPQSQSAIWNGQNHELPLQHQPQLTLWHELGHLEVKRLQGNVLPAELSELDHEWLADTYLAWRCAKEWNSLELVWQQYHRRNLAVISDIGNLSHWSPLYLIQVLRRYDQKKIAGFADFTTFVLDFYPIISSYSQDEVAEFSSLLQHLFSRNRRQALPGYMFWRREQLGRVLQPTLEQLLGTESANFLLFKEGMLQ